MLDNVCCVLNFQGFPCADKRFFCRELGYANCLDELEPSGVVHFDLNHLRLNDVDSRTAWYCTRFVHGLGFESRPGERNRPHDRLKSSVVQIWNRYKVSGGGGGKKKEVIAYKGESSAERRLLEDLNIPSLNLEEYECPKFNNHLKALACPLHTRGREVECARTKARLYRDWIRNNVVA